jgi:hypothetical protein
MLRGNGGAERGLIAYRVCRRADAQWLASPCAAASQRRMAEVLLVQGEDPRGVYVARELTGGPRSNPRERQRWASSHGLEDRG